MNEKKESFELDENGRTIVSLGFPFTAPLKERAQPELISEVRLRRMKVGDFRYMPKEENKESPFGYVPVISRLLGMPEPSVCEIDASDFTRIVSVVLDFFGETQTSG